MGPDVARVISYQSTLTIHPNAKISGRSPVAASTAAAVYRAASIWQSTDATFRKLLFHTPAGVEAVHHSGTLAAW